ncbi:MAG: tetratricopeptide repeat protein [Myxococcales bacterium]|nr:tetratricopeptide repeat protein [Myxococcales bacterium]
MRRRIAAGVLGCFIGGLTPASSFAQGSSAAAEALFDQARSAMDLGEYDEACEKFRESNRLDPAPGTVLNLANCEEKRGKLATAWELFRAVEDQLPAGDDRIPVARDRAAKLKPRLPRLTIDAGTPPPDGIQVTRDGIDLGTASLGTPLPVDPGEHEVVVTLPGKAPTSFQVFVVEGESKTLDVLGAETTSDEGSGSATDDSSSGKQTLGLVFGGIGVAGVVIGSVTGLMALGKQSTVDDECDSNGFCSAAGADAASSGSSLATISTIGWVVGALGIGAGAYFLLSGEKEGPKTGFRAGFTPTGSALSLFHTW